MTVRKLWAAPALLGATADFSLILCSRTADNAKGGGVYNQPSTLYRSPRRPAGSTQAAPVPLPSRTEAAPPRSSVAATAVQPKRLWLGCLRSSGTSPRFRQSGTPHLGRNE